MIASAVKRSVRPLPTVKTGKVCFGPPILVVELSAYKNLRSASGSRSFCS
jgi:hypothetical protein